MRSGSPKRAGTRDSADSQKATIASQKGESRSEQLREQSEEVQRSKIPPKQGPLERGEIKKREHVHRLQRRGEPPRGAVKK
jgi:hypothetical protein